MGAVKERPVRRPRLLIVVLLFRSYLSPSRRIR